MENNRREAAAFWVNKYSLGVRWRPLKVLWPFDEGATQAALVHTFIALAWQLVLLMVLVRRFSQVAKR